MEIASFCIPLTGGVYTVARNLRMGLQAEGVALRWIGVGEQGRRAWNDPDMVSERVFGEIVPEAKDDRAQAEAVIRHIEERGYKVVFFDVLGGFLQANVARYLPRSIVRLMIVHNITPGTYGQARALRDYVHATVAVSPRIREDLVGRYGFPSDHTHMIPHGVPMAPFDGVRRAPTAGRLRLVSLGRVEDSAKGVFWLVDIMKELGKDGVSLTVGGDGPDLESLRERASVGSQQMEFLGRVKAHEVPALLARHDVLLMPSRYEGFGLTIVEAMAAGCVPVVSRIRGVTDYIVEAGQTGFLFPVSDVRCAAGIVRQLAEDPALLNRVSDRAHQVVRARFPLPGMIDGYAALIRRYQKTPPPVRPPLALDLWKYPRGLRRSWRSRLPGPIKNVLRQWRERIG